MKKIFLKKDAADSVRWIRTFCTMMLMAVGLAACGDDEKIVGMNELPDMAQSFIAYHFHGVRIMSIVYDREDREYDVTLVDGTEIEFDRNGNWLSVDCRFGALPDGILPASVTSCVQEKHPEGHVHSVEKKVGGYQVEVTDASGMEWEMYFGLDGTFVRENRDM